MLRRGSLRPRHGFTTIEALVAAVVFLLGLSGLLGALTQARNATGQARRYMQATDIANDLVEQIQLWSPDDARLKPTLGPCLDDPLDTKGVLLQSDENASSYQAYWLCMKTEKDITISTKWAGLARPEFTDEQGVVTPYDRAYIVQEQQVRPGVKRLQIWVKVRYEDASGAHVVTTQAMRLRMGI